MKVLIVDDENLDLFITKKLIGMEHQVEGFTSIGDATAWAASNTFDVLLSDYYLGEGKHATDALKALRSGSKSSFSAFVLSNHIDDQQAQMLKAAGFSSIIEKPITLEKFREALASIKPA